MRTTGFLDFVEVAALVERGLQPLMINQRLIELTKFFIYYQGMEVVGGKVADPVRQILRLC